MIGSTYYNVGYLVLIAVMVGIWIMQRRRAGTRAWMRKAALDLILAAFVLISYWMFIEDSTNEAQMLSHTMNSIALCVGAALLFAGVDLFRATSSPSE